MRGHSESHVFYQSRLAEDALRLRGRRSDGRESRGARQSGAAIKVASRRRLNAALAKTTNQSTFGRAPGMRPARGALSA